jgi:next-to-BRCA1 protein 1
LNISSDQAVVFERYSDSSASYVVLDEDDEQVFKTLLRAAKAKLKLRLKVTAARTAVPTTSNEQIGQQENTGNQQQDTGADQRASLPCGYAFGDPPIRFDSDAARSAPSFYDPSNANTSSLPIRSKPPVTRLTPWSVYCNECDSVMSDTHFHCSICDDGDYDLCEECVNKGKVCPGKDHWLVKRSIRDGKVFASTTERIRKTIPAPVAAPPPAETGNAVIVNTRPASTLEASKIVLPSSTSRTCNGCVVVLPDRDFVHCDTCEDFDLCIKCHSDNKHGHHPAHGFTPATKDTVISTASRLSLAPGRDVRHNAVCDSCDKHIRGIRHKCLNCPDWDYCNECIKFADHRHVGHRFVAIYEPIADVKTALIRHSGVMCDGPLCSNKPNGSFIHGIRYKCTICHDTDFCASCEAHPSNKHNVTHPLLKLKTAVGNVSISTENEVAGGEVRVMGDRRPLSVAAMCTPTNDLPQRQTNTATAVQTVAEIKPIEVKKEEAPAPALIAPNTLPFDAQFISETIGDGTAVQSGELFTQVWVMKNTGHLAWPAGCSVRFVGGDNMLNIDNNHPSSVNDIPQASETNIVARKVESGETVAFKVTLKAPIRLGKCISYWRLKSADGNAFGQRLWCDVIVVPASAPAPVTREITPVTAEDQFAQWANGVRAQVAPSVPADGFNQWANGIRAQALSREQAQAQAQAQAAARAQILGFQAKRREQASLQQQQQQILTHQMHQQAQMQVQQQAQQQAHLQAHLQAQQQAQMHAHHAKQVQMLGQMSSRAPKQYTGGVEYGSSLDYANQMGARLPQEEASGLEGNHRLQDYQTQLMLLEKQNKKRLLFTRMEKERSDMAALQNEQPPNPEITTARQGMHPRFWQPNWQPTPDMTTETPASLAVKPDQAAPVVADTNEKVQRILLEHANNTTAEDDATTQAAMERSSMVFPKLDRESPASSAYQSVMSNSGKAAYVENEDGQVENVAIPTTAVAPSVASEAEQAKFDDEDIEVLSATGDDSDEDDTFDTDDEYDILDASDEETVV